MILHHNLWHSFISLRYRLVSRIGPIDQQIGILSPLSTWYVGMCAHWRALFSSAECSEDVCCGSSLRVALAFVSILDTFIGYVFGWYVTTSSRTKDWILVSYGCWFGWRELTLSGNIPSPLYRILNILRCGFFIWMLCSLIIIELHVFLLIFTYSLYSIDIL